MNNDYAPIYVKYSEEYDFSNDDLQFKKSTSNYAIKAYLLEDILHKQNLSKKECLEIMISKLKKTNFYKIKTEKEIEEFILFLKDDSNLSEILKPEEDEENEDDEFSDDSFTDFITF